MLGYIVCDLVEKRADRCYHNGKEWKNNCVDGMEWRVIKLGVEEACKELPTIFSTALNNEHKVRE